MHSDFYLAPTFLQCSYRIIFNNLSRMSSLVSNNCHLPFQIKVKNYHTLNVVELMTVRRSTMLVVTSVRNPLVSKYTATDSHVHHHGEQKDGKIAPRRVMVGIVPVRSSVCKSLLMVLNMMLTQDFVQARNQLLLNLVILWHVSLNGWHNLLDRYGGFSTCKA